MGKWHLHRSISRQRSTVIRCSDKGEEEATDCCCGTSAAENVEKGYGSMVFTLWGLGVKHSDSQPWTGCCLSAVRLLAADGAASENRYLCLDAADLPLPMPGALTAQGAGARENHAFWPRRVPWLHVYQRLKRQSVQDPAAYYRLTTAVRHRIEYKTIFSLDFHAV